MPSDQTLYLYTSLTAGSSHIITATSRLETILKANKIPFRAIDVATDEKARQLWGRRSKGRKLPGLVKFNEIVGDLEQIEEWNEYGELKMTINTFEDPDNFISEDNPAYTKPTVTSPTTATTPVTTGPPKSINTPHIQIKNPPAEVPKVEERITLALRQAGEEAAAKAKDSKAVKTGAKPAEAAAETSVEKPEEKASSPKEPSPSKPDSAETTAEKPTRVDETAEERESKKAENEQADPGCRKSVVPAPEIPSRPSLAPEVAAVSTANFSAENAEALGLVEHHRGSIVSASSPEESDSVRRDIRSSISESPKETTDQPKGDLAEQKEHEQTVEEEEADALPPTKEEKEKLEKEKQEKEKAEKEKEEKEKAEKEKTEEERAEEEKAEKAKEVEETPQKQDPKAAEQAGISVQD